MIASRPSNVNVLAVRPQIATLVVAAVLACFAPLAARADMKIGTFDKQRMVDQSKLGSGAKSRFEKLQSAREGEIEERKKAFESLKKTYETQAGALSDEKKLEKQRELARMRDEVQSAMDNADRDLQRAYQQALVEIVQKLDPVLAEYAKAESYDFLFDQTQFAFAKPEYDVTDKIIAKIDAMYPQ